MHIVHGEGSNCSDIYTRDQSNIFPLSPFPSSELWIPYRLLNKVTPAIIEHTEIEAAFHLGLADSCNMLGTAEPATITPHTVPASRRRS